MWIFTTYGFFSVVNTTSSKISNGDIDPIDQVVEVRSRYREHLESLKDRFNELIGPEEILGYDDPSSLYRNRDYEYRIIINAETWVHLGAMLSADITYPNFKDEVLGSLAEDPRLAKTPYIDQLHSVYNVVQNEDRWAFASDTIN